jgi:perosamine synthetase
MFAKKIEKKYAISVSNGTAALDLAIEALGISAGDEVIMPSFTIISCINQIIRCSAVPILLDCDPFTFNMNVEEIEKKITKKTKAIMVVHIYGMPVDMDPVLRLAKKFNLFIIEDASEVLGQDYKGKPCGSFGDISTFSFYSNKHITTGEGGMVAVNNKALADTCKGLRNLCFNPKKRFVHNRLGWNMRMTNIQAAVGVAQLERIEEFIKRKRDIGKRYNKLLNGLPNIQLPVKKNEIAENIYWVFSLVIERANPMTAETAIKKFFAKNIGCRPFFYPMHMQPVLKKKGFFRKETFPNSENLYKHGFYIPSGLGITDNEIEIVADAAWEIFN